MTNALLLPLRHLKKEYIPLLVVYFTTGLAGLTAVTQTVFFKDQITLEATTLIELGVYIGLPWSIKMLFGSLIDSFKIAGNNRKSYIYLGQALVFGGMALMVDHTSTRVVFDSVGEYAGLLAAGLLVTLGVVVSDIVADILAIELVSKEAENRDKELGMVQVLSRLALALGAVCGAFLAGLLATHLSAAQVYSVALLCPTIAVVATILAPTPALPIKTSPPNRPLIIGGILYGVFVVFAGVFLNQDVIFLVSLGIIGLMVRSLLRDFPAEAVRPFILSMIAIFLFRTVPGIGPAGGWWYMNELGFDEQFMGTLRIIASISGLVVLYFLADKITSGSIFKTMLVLTIFMTILSLPDILIYYNLTMGLSPRTVALMDTAMVAPLGQLSMIPLGVIIARNAPEHARGAYISVTASLMNISLVGGDVITKHLNKIYTVTRNDFSELGQLMIVSLSISTVLSIIGLIVLKRGVK